MENIRDLLEERIICIIGELDVQPIGSERREDLMKELKDCIKAYVDLYDSGIVAWEKSERLCFDREKLKKETEQKTVQKEEEMRNRAFDTLEKLILFIPPAALAVYLTKAEFNGNLLPKSPLQFMSSLLKLGR